MSRRPPDPPAVPAQDVIAAWVGLMRAQRVALAAIERELKAAELPPLAWYDVLLELSRAADGRLRPYELEERTLLTQHNLSRLLDRMETGGLLRRDAFEADGRGRWVVLTDAGRDIRSRMWSVYAPAIQAHVGDKLEGGRAGQLAELLACVSR